MIQACLSEDYLADTGGRIAIYQRLAQLQNTRQIEKLRTELREDKFGQNTLYADLTPLARLSPGQDALEVACQALEGLPAAGAH